MVTEEQVLGLPCATCRTDVDMHLTRATRVGPGVAVQFVPAAQLQPDALEQLLARLVEARVAARVRARQADEARAWWCRTCSFTACGRPAGRCPAQATAARLMGNP